MNFLLTLLAFEPMTTPAIAREIDQ